MQTHPARAGRAGHEARGQPVGLWGVAEALDERHRIVEAGGVHRQVEAPMWARLPTDEGVDAPPAPSPARDPRTRQKVQHDADLAQLLTPSR